MQSVMLACSRFRGSHTGDAIAEEYERVVTSFHLTQKISFVVTDSASNMHMIKAISLPGFEEDAEDDVESEESDEEQEDNYQGSIGIDAYSELNQHNYTMFCSRTATCH